MMLQDPAITRLPFATFATSFWRAASMAGSCKWQSCLWNAVATWDLPSNDNWDCHNFVSLPASEMIFLDFSAYALVFPTPKLTSLVQLFWCQSCSLKQSLALSYLGCPHPRNLLDRIKNVKNVIYLFAASFGYLDLCSPVYYPDLSYWIWNALC